MLYFKKIVSSYCDFKRCSFNAQHILILPTIKHSFDGKLMIYGFESEFMFRINVLVKKKKNLHADSPGFVQARGQSAALSASS